MFEIKLPNKKRPFIKINVPDNMFIETNGNKTFNEFKKEYDMGMWIPNKDVITILDKYIANGYGNDKINKYFRED